MSSFRDHGNFQFPNLPPGDYKMVITVNGVDSNEAVISIK
jgi:hypothetical protein